MCMHSCFFVAYVYMSVYRHTCVFPCGDLRLVLEIFRNCSSNYSVRQDISNPQLAYIAILTSQLALKVLVLPSRDGAEVSR